MMWILYAFLSALFAGGVAILSKIGLQKVESHLATALRTIVVLLFTFVMVFVTNGFASFQDLTWLNYLFIVLSGLATGASWLCYFRALQLGDVNKVVPIDKSSVILTVILSVIIFQEAMTWYILIGMVILAGGTFLMIEKKPVAATQSTPNKSRSLWFIYAICAAVFASLTSILAKFGLTSGVNGVKLNSDLITALRTIVVLVMAWLIVFSQKKHHMMKQIDGKSWIYIGLSGLATGISWLFYYKALQDGSASIVVPIDKLSIVVTIAFSYYILKEKLSRKAFIGFLFIILGTLLLIFDKIILIFT